MKKLLLGIGLFSGLMATPSGMSVCSGSAKATSKGIQTSDKAILQWRDFSIQSGEIVRFIQPDSSSSCLNRVSGSQMSQILGRLESNGKVYLINPQGLFIGPDAVIDTAGFVGSTFDVLDGDYLKGAINFFGLSDAKIVSLGKINCPDGEVTLFAKHVENKGEIIGADVWLKADGVYIKPDGELDGRATYAYGVRSSGHVQATGSEERGGRIHLIASHARTEVTGDLKAKGGEVQILGEEVIVQGRSVIDVSDGGTVLVGGDYQGQNPNIQNAKNTHVGEGVMIYAQGGNLGDGGRVIVWSDGYTDFCGEVNVRGGDEGGDGGFVEVSGLKSFHYCGRADRRAPFGTCGTLLLDPDSDITVTTGANVNMSFGAGTFSPTADTANLDIGNAVTPGTLLGELALGSVVISTVNPAGTQTGVIALDESFTMTGSTKLTCDATGTCIVRGDIASSYAGAKTDVLELNGNVVGTGTVTSSSGIFFDGGSLTTVNGNVIVNGRGGVAGGSQRGISSSSGITITSTGLGDITMIGESGGSTASNVGINFGGTSSVTAVNGAISITGTCSDSYGGADNIGILIANTTTVETTGLGTITMVGLGGDGVSGGTGIFISGSSALINQTSSSAISLTGTGRGSGDNNYGITIQGGGKVTGANGTVTLVGFGGTDDISNNQGVYMTGVGSDVSSSTGTISITGTGGGQNNFNTGIQMETSSRVISSTGEIIMMGTGSTNGSDGDNNGIFMSGASSVTSGGTISLTGIAGDNEGIGMEGGSRIIGLFNSAVTLDGTGSGGYGVDISGSATLVTADTGSVTVIGRESGGSGLGAHLSELGMISSTASATVDVSTFSDLLIESGGQIVGGSDTVTILVSNDIFIFASSTASETTGIILGTGDASITAMRDLIMFGTAALSSPAQIGSRSGTGSTAAISFPFIGGDLMIDGTRPGSHVTIGHGDPSLSAVFSGNITASVGKDISVRGATFAGAGPLGTAQIGHIDAGGSSLSGDIDLTATGAVFVTGGTTTASSYARIGHGGQGAGTVTSSTMTIKAGTNLTMTSNMAPAQIENLATAGGSGNLTLVVDNLFPTMPNFGTGAFTLNSDLNATGELRIYTVSPLLNTINDLINGAIFVPGPFDVDSNTEQYGTYFPGGTFGGAVFKIYYKVGGQTQVITATRVIDEIFIQSVAMAELEDRLPSLRYMRLGNYPPYHGEFCRSGVCDPSLDPYGSFIFEDNIYWIGSDR